MFDRPETVVDAATLGVVGIVVALSVALGVIMGVSLGTRQAVHRARRHQPGATAGGAPVVSAALVPRPLAAPPSAPVGRMGDRVYQPAVLGAPRDAAGVADTVAALRVVHPAGRHPDPAVRPGARIPRQRAGRAG